MQARPQVQSRQAAALKKLTALGNSTCEEHVMYLAPGLYVSNREAASPAWHAPVGEVHVPACMKQDPQNKVHVKTACSK